MDDDNARMASLRRGDHTVRARRVEDRAAEAARGDRPTPVPGTVQRYLIDGRTYVDRQTAEVVATLLGVPVKKTVIPLEDSCRS